MPDSHRWKAACRLFQRSALIVLAMAFGPAWSRAADPEGEPPLPPAAKEKVSFARVRPILETHCLKCHVGPDPKSGLRLDTRENLLTGGYTGPAIVVGKSAESELIQRVSGLDPETVMPPEGGRLNKDQVSLLRAWIDQGAAWPEGLVLRSNTGTESQTQAHWSLQPVRRSTPPTVQQPDWVRNPIDRFILHRLESEGIAPAPEANRETLVRRLSLDLIGLPATPDETSAFVADDRPEAHDRLIDRLLASPHYGEKWARSWMDLCHYGDSDGYLTDQLRPHAWRYRQWLVNALNANLPYDQFTLEQLAGDLLPAAAEEQRIATGFLRQTLSNREGGADLEEYRVEQVIDRTATAATIWLGLTFGCARCHDHKYDPVSQKGFYELYAFFNNADEVNIDAPLASEREAYLAHKPEYERKRRELIAPVAERAYALQRVWEARMLEAVEHPGRDHRWDRQWEVLGLIWGGNLGEGQLEGTEIVKIGWDRRTQDQKDRLFDYFLKHGSIADEKGFAALKLGELSAQLEKLKSEQPAVSRAPIMREAQTPRQAYIHLRGSFRDRGIDVSPATPAFLPRAAAGESKTRVDLARWLVSPQNPLSARVAVNRMWQEFFGRGIVFTAEDFGVRGTAPTHPELLDWLADEFMRSGWNVKHMHRLIVTSATYRQSSAHRPELMTKDPGNTLLARQSSLRLPAEAIRDSALAVSGLLTRQLDGPSVRPPQPESVVMEGFGERDWKISAGADRYRRGLYTFALRSSPFAQNVTFDAPNPSQACTRRERSNTPLQALTLLNDPVFFEAAQSLADRMERGAPHDSARQIAEAFRLCLTRSPTAGELARLVDFLDEQRGRTGIVTVAAAGADVDRQARIAVASVLLNLHEFVTRD